MLRLISATMVRQAAMSGSIKEGKMLNLLVLDSSLNIVTIDLKGKKAY
ncbi:hypothetical protein BN193_08980 [Lactococcus raffinolactis 4877]|nr:hypothetical protein BN193_08980 [Lactococcus raffinolactis 4877]